MLQINIKKYRENLGMSQYKLAELMGLSQSTIGMWESGKSNPGYSNLVKLAEILGVSIGDLSDKESKIYPPASQSIIVPVLGRIPAGMPIEAVEDILDYEEIPADWTAGGKQYFALKIGGNSMSPKYLYDDVVIFLKADSCDHGAECAVLVNGDDATFKKVIKRKDGIILQPLNMLEHDQVFFSNEDVDILPVRIIGIAKEIRRKVQ